MAVQGNAIHGNPGDKPPELHITVGSASDGHLRSSVSKDLKLVKSALLYADRVSLISPATTMLLAAVAIPDLPLRDKLHVLREVTPLVDDSQGAAEAIAALEALTTSRQARRRLAKHLEPTFDKMRMSYAQLVSDVGADDLIRAVNDGHVILHTFGLGNEGTEHADDAAVLGWNDGSDDVTQRYVTGVLESIHDPRTFPLLDEQSHQLIRAGERAGVFRFTSSEADKGKHVALAGQLFDQLPALDAAPLDELIAVREELRGPLTRFRSAMLRMSASIQGAPWSADFPFDAQRIQHEEVEPAILELRERFEANGYLRHLANDLLGDAKFLPTLVVAVTGGWVVAESLLGQGSAAGIAGAAYLGSKSWQAEQRRRAELKSLQEREMYFYYRLRRSR